MDSLPPPYWAATIRCERGVEVSLTCSSSPPPLILAALSALASVWGCPHRHDDTERLVWRSHPQEAP